MSQFIRPLNGIQTKLSCVRPRTTGSGKNRSTPETVLWQDQHQTAGGMTDAIAVRFAIPADRRATDDTDPDDQIVWRLNTRAELPGVDFAAQFEVPVFKTTPSSA